MLTSTVATLHDNPAHGDDNYLIRDLGNNSFFDAVMDGVSGHGGEEASRSVKEALAEATLNSMGDVEEILKDLNDEFFQVGGGRFLLTTIAAALYVDDRLYIIGAGDSPAILVEPDSHQQLAGRIGGFLHVGVARAIGANAQLSNLSLNEVRANPGSRLILATDGVTDNIVVEELADMTRQAASPDAAAEKIDGAIATLLSEGRMPAQLGGRFRHDDRTAIFRFFANPG